MKRVKAMGRSDLVNRMASDDSPKRMQSPLGTRRKRSVETVLLWSRVAKSATVEAGYQPVEERVRVVKAAFVIAGLAAKHQEAGGLAQLLFDNFSHPALAGTRSTAMRIRQLLYRAEPYQIDLQIELHTDRNVFVVTGQLVDLSHPEMVGRDVPVTLSDGRESVVRTMTNQFGEFRGEIENSGDLQISFLGSSEKPIVILLRGPLNPWSESKAAAKE